MSNEEANLQSEQPAKTVLLRKVDFNGSFELKNIMRCSRYFLGSLVCFIILGLTFQSLSLVSFFMGLFGIILLERSIYVVSGMRTR